MRICWRRCELCRTREKRDDRLTLVAGYRLHQSHEGRQATDRDATERYAAYADGFAAGDGDAYIGLPADWARYPVAAFLDVYAADRETGYADGHAQETARQEAAS